MHVNHLLGVVLVSDIEDAKRWYAFRQVIWPRGGHEFWPHLV
jgi:hypothetical protein